MLFVGLLILGEFLERQFKNHFERLTQKQKELGVKLPPYPKPIFVGSTKTTHTLKAKPGSKSGDNVLLIQFEHARIHDYTFESIHCKFNFKIYITTKHFMTLADITDVIMSIHRAPIHIEDFQNVFTEKGYVKPQVHILRANIESVTNLEPIDKSMTETFKFVVNVSFDTRINWTPNLKSQIR